MYMDEMRGVSAVHMHKEFRSKGNGVHSQSTLNVSSCDSGTKLSLGLNCYCTGVFICTKPALGVALLVPPMLLNILHAHTQILSISTLLCLSYLYISKNQHFLFHLIQSYYILFLLF